MADDKKTFEAAFEALSDDQVYSGKYGASDAPESAPEPVNEADRKRIREQREAADFESWVGQVDKLDDPKRRVHTSSLENEFAQMLEAEELDAVQPMETAPAAPFEPISSSSPLLNLRRIPADKAITKLAVFVDFAKRDGTREFQVVYATDAGVNEFDIERWFQTVGLSYGITFEHHGHTQRFDVRIG